MALVTVTLGCAVTPSHKIWRRPWHKRVSDADWHALQRRLVINGQNRLGDHLGDRHGFVSDGLASDGWGSPDERAGPAWVESPPAGASDDLKKLNGVLRYSEGTALNGFSLTGMDYGNHWNSTDQIPERAVPFIGLFGSLDPTDGGNAQRFSVSGQWAKTDAGNAWQANVFAVRSALNLWTDFTYFLQNPTFGDQFRQHETRTIAGADAS